MRHVTHSEIVLSVVFVACHNPYVLDLYGANIALRLVSLQEQLTLEPYERDHAVVVGIYRPPPKK
jgi:hypothetical protein